LPDPGEFNPGNDLAGGGDDDGPDDAAPASSESSEVDESEYVRLRRLLDKPPKNIFFDVMVELTQQRIKSFMELANSNSRDISLMAREALKLECLKLERLMEQADLYTKLGDTTHMSQADIFKLRSALSLLPGLGEEPKTPESEGSHTSQGVEPEEEGLSLTSGGTSTSARTFNLDESNPNLDPLARLTLQKIDPIHPNILLEVSKEELNDLVEVRKRVLNTLLKSPDVEVREEAKLLLVHDQLMMKRTPNKAESIPTNQAPHSSHSKTIKSDPTLQYKWPEDKEGWPVMPNVTRPARSPDIAKTPAVIRASLTAVDRVTGLIEDLRRQTGNIFKKTPSPESSKERFDYDEAEITEPTLDSVTEPEPRKPTQVTPGQASREESKISERSLAKSFLSDIVGVIIQTKFDQMRRTGTTPKATPSPRMQAKRSLSFATPIESGTEFDASANAKGGVFTSTPGATAVVADPSPLLTPAAKRVRDWLAEAQISTSDSTKSKLAEWIKDDPNIEEWFGDPESIDVDLGDTDYGASFDQSAQTPKG